MEVSAWMVPKVNTSTPMVRAKARKTWMALAALIPLKFIQPNSNSTAETKASSPALMSQPAIV